MFAFDALGQRSGSRDDLHVQLDQFDRADGSQAGRLGVIELRLGMRRLGNVAPDSSAFAEDPVPSPELSKPVLRKDRTLAASAFVANFSSTDAYDGRRRYVRHKRRIGFIGPSPISDGDQRQGQIHREKC